MPQKLGSCSPDPFFTGRGNEQSQSTTCEGFNGGVSQRFDNCSRNLYGINPKNNLETACGTPDASRKMNELQGDLPSKRDMVNYKVIEGHKYEIKLNPDRNNCVNKRLYICKYDNCNKVFTKTWNLVSHFRIHTNEKPYQCSKCLKLFTQRSNLSRHMSIHCKSKSIDRKIYGCTECSRKYSSKYNLNVSMNSSINYIFANILI